MSKEISVEVWGDLACFTDPASKVERAELSCPDSLGGAGDTLRNLFQAPGVLLAGETD